MPTKKLRKRPLKRAKKYLSLENENVNWNDPAVLAEILHGGRDAWSGMVIGRKEALTYGAFWRGVQIVSSTVAKLPLFVYARIDGGKDRATTHPAYRLLRYKPNQYMTAYVFRQTLQAQVMTTGNGFAAIIRNESGEPIELLPLNPDSTYPVRVNGTMWYVYRQNAVEFKLPDSDVLHVKGLGFDGFLGYNVIEYARNCLGTGLAAEEYGARFFANNAEPRVVLEAPAKLDDKTVAIIRRQWNEIHEGLDSSHRTAVLHSGLTVKPFSTSAKDSQLMELRRFQIRDVANWVGVPAYMLGDDTKSSYNSLESENQNFLDNSLDPWLVAWEMECWDKLLTEREKQEDSHVIEFLRQALIRANMTERANAYHLALQDGWMSRDEIRERENMNAIPDGSGGTFLRPLNMTPSTTEPEPGDNGADAERLAAMRSAALRLWADTTRRMMGRLIESAERCAKRDAANWPKWIAELPDEHTRVVEEAFAGVAAIFAPVFGGKEADIVSMMAAGVIAESRAIAAEMSATRGGDIPDALRSHADKLIVRIASYNGREVQHGNE